MRFLIGSACLVSCSAPWVPDWLRDKGPIHYTYGPDPDSEHRNPFPSLRPTRDAGPDAGR